MIATRARKSLVAVVMALTIMAGLITGFAHTKAAALPSTTGVRTIHGQVAGWCPPPPVVCSPIG